MLGTSSNLKFELLIWQAVPVKLHLNLSLQLTGFSLNFEDMH